MNILERILVIKKELGYKTDGDFADALDINRSNFSQMKKGNRTIGDNILNKISVQLNISKNWLLTGEGAMLKEEKEPYIANKESLIDNQLISSKLKDYFNSIGVFQKEIAEVLGVSQQAVSVHLNGRPFGKKNASLWAEKFGLNPIWLLTGEGSMLKEEKEPYVANEESLKVQDAKSVYEPKEATEVYYLKKILEEKDKVIEGKEKLLEEKDKAILLYKNKVFEKDKRITELEELVNPNKGR